MGRFPAFVKSAFVRKSSQIRFVFDRQLVRLTLNLTSAFLHFRLFLNVSFSWLRVISRSLCRVFWFLRSWHWRSSLVWTSLDRTGSPQVYHGQEFGQSRRRSPTSADSDLLNIALLKVASVTSYWRSLTSWLTD
jgi:hypothetical protein